MKKSLCVKLVVLMVFMQSLSGCSVSSVVNRPERVSQDSVKVGMPREDLLDRFGSPIDTKENEDGLKVDIFRVPEGESDVGKGLKGGSLLLLGIFTLGLSEIIAHPVTEKQKYVTFEVTYDKDERVKLVRFISK